MKVIHLEHDGLGVGSFYPERAIGCGPAQLYFSSSPALTQLALHNQCRFSLSNQKTEKRYLSDPPNLTLILHVNYKRYLIFSDMCSIMN